MCKLRVSRDQQTQTQGDGDGPKCIEKSDTGLNATTQTSRPDEKGDYSPNPTPDEEASYCNAAESYPPGGGGPSRKTKRIVKYVALGIGGAAICGVGAIAAVTVALPAAGFTAGGVAAGSIAAAIQSSIGSVAAGSAFAAAQSAGAAGLAASTSAALFTGGAAVGTAAGIGVAAATDSDQPEQPSQHAQSPSGQLSPEPAQHSATNNRSSVGTQTHSEVCTQTDNLEM